MAPTCRAQEPVAVTTVSQVMSPCVVFTSHSPARVRWMAVTSVLPVDFGTPVARTLGQRLGHVHRRHVAVMGVEEGAHQPVEVAERPEIADLVGADQLEGDADGVSQCRSSCGTRPSAPGWWRA